MRHLLVSVALSAAVLAPSAASAQTSVTLAPAPVAAPVAVATPAPAPASTAAPASDAATVPQTSAVAPSHATMHPEIAGIRIAASRSEADNGTHEVSSAAAEGLHQGEGIALMAVGGAGLVAGLLIGGGAGSAVAIGGLAVGLVGLYQYVR